MGQGWFAQAGLRTCSAQHGGGVQKGAAIGGWGPLLRPKHPDTLPYNKSQTTLGTV